jgi:hypothetical protein
VVRADTASTGFDASTGEALAFGDARARLLGIASSRCGQNPFSFVVAGMSIMEYNGSAVLAMTGKQCVALACALLL